MAETRAAIEDARSVALAANALLRSIQTGRGGRQTAVDRLEFAARLSIETSAQGFDASPSGALDDEDVLSSALSQLSIGTTLLAAESATAEPSSADRLRLAVARLEGTANALAMEDSPPTPVQGFDSRSAAAPLGVAAAARVALDEMAASAGNVATAILDKALKPLVEQVPQGLRDMISGWDLDIPGRLARWGLRAVRRGLDLLSRLVDGSGIERIRATVDSVLARLGRGEDAKVLTGWAIGVDGVRAAVDTLMSDEPSEVVGKLADLAARFGKLCRLLGRVAVAIVGAASALALLHLAVPHVGVATAAGLALVMCVMVLLGRDYTGAGDLPGPIRGVRLLIVADHDAST